MIDELMQLDNQLCFRLYNVSRKMTKAYQPLLSKFNLTYPQYIILLILFEHRELDFKELSTIINLKTGTLTPILQTLEKQGIVQKIKNKADNRKVNISLTKEGELLQDKLRDVPVTMQERLQITLEMYQILVKELDELEEILDNNEVKE